MSKIFASVCIYDRPEAMFDITFESARKNSQHQIVVYHEIGCSSLVLVRNRHIARFLQDPQYADCEYFCSLDSDLVLHNHGKGQDNLFDMMVNDGVDFTGGVYRLKAQHHPCNWPCASLPMDEQRIPYRCGLIEMMWLSGGCWLVARAALQNMWDAYYTELLDNTREMGDMVCLFNPLIIELAGGKHKMLTEDWAFCHRWRQLGGRIWCNSAIRLSHTGKYDYDLWKENEHLGGSFGVSHNDPGALKYLRDRYNIKTMFDVGCGLGGNSGLAEWHGIDWTGIDGQHGVTLEMPVIIHDYTTGPLPDAVTGRDLAWSVEFVEHVSDCYWPNVADTFKRCRVVCFTFARPNYIGHHHVNCRDEDHWKQRMAEAGFMFDAEGTEGVRKASDMRREFVRETGLVFVRQA